jgi:glycosyltransferase involved in cell wall biosynthesis
MRIAVLWTDLPGYLLSSLKALSEQHQVELLVVRGARVDVHPLPASSKAWIKHYLALPDTNLLERHRILERELRKFSPDVLLVSGWTFLEYLAVVVNLKRQNVKSIMCIDNQWLSTLKQHTLLPVARQILPRIFDFAWGAGVRQADFLGRLGFSNRRILRGVYAADTNLFEQAAAIRKDNMASGASWPHQFLFVASFQPWKGVNQLLKAYTLYRDLTPDPWPLMCVGGGPLEEVMAGYKGVSAVKFLPPADLAQIYAQSGVFILPSLYEPYGVVIHEAAAAGLPILCSIVSGAGIDMIRDGYNGYLFDPHDANHLAQLMYHMSSGQVNLSLMGQRSQQLSYQLSSARWADYLMETLTLKAGLSAVSDAKPC